MAFFILGIENEDTTLKPPPKSGNKAIDDVYEGISRLNELFKKAKIDITTQEQYFKKVIKQSATGLFSINSKERVININPAAMKLTQLYEFHHINSLRNIDEALPGFLIHEPLQQNSAIFENQFGQKLLFKLSEIKITNEKLRLVAVSDLTKELDNGEVEAWIKLARTLSHEIMNNIAPVTTLSQVISGYFLQNNQALKIEDISEKTIHNTIKGLAVIEDRSRGLMKFVENYRKFTKLPQPDFEEVDLSKLLDKSILAITTYPNFEQIQLIKKIPENIHIQIDAQLLSQVIHNILKNSYESLTLPIIENPQLLVQLYKNEHQLLIEISNNGPDIPPEIKEQIFVPFFTTKEQGSGVGLSLSKQIMLKMNGDIYLKKNDNKMTSFVIAIKVQNL
jgi:nitrogen fixation/metabolism regulation signal transduction histidine kinase